MATITPFTRLPLPIVCSTQPMQRELADGVVWAAAPLEFEDIEVVGRVHRENVNRAYGGGELDLVASVLWARYYEGPDPTHASLNDDHASCHTAL
ncbi:MAG: hypothetical protein ACLPN5_11515 [Roseiarcus sp.]